MMKNGNCVGQKKLRALCFIQPTLDLKMKTLTLSYPNKKEKCVLPIDPDASKLLNFKVCIGKVCFEPMEGLDCGQEVSDWLEDATGEGNLRLVRQTQRNSKIYKNKMSLANEAPFLFANRSSVEELQRRMSEECSDTFGRFNIDQLTNQFR